MFSSTSMNVVSQEDKNGILKIFAWGIHIDHCDTTTQLHHQMFLSHCTKLLHQQTQNPINKNRFEEEKKLQRGRMKENGGKKRFWGCCWSCLKVGLVVVPLVLVVCLGSQKSCCSYSSPWLWKSSSVGVDGSYSERNVDDDLHAIANARSVNDQVDEDHKALSHHQDFAFNHSSSSSSSLLVKESIQIKQPDKIKDEVEKSLINGSSDIVVKRRRVNRSSSKLENLELGLARARAAIKEAAQSKNQTPDHYVPQGPMYWKANAFHRSYLEMEKRFKVYIYEEGEPPLFHNGPCKSIYATEGNFIHAMEIDPQFRTRDPEKAHVFFLPFSVSMMVQFIYVSDSHDTSPLKRTVVDYMNIISQKYPYWNRSLGADHFMLSCHDWGPLASSYNPYLYSNAIRVLCNANTSEGFNPSKDASFPEINLQTGEIDGWIGGPSPSHRSVLAFFAGGLHGPIRPILLNHWKNIDDDIQVHEYLPKGMSYYSMLKKSKFCICPSGYEVASPRIVEAIYTGCVPVLISDHYVPPFSDVLNWKSFAVVIQAHDIPSLKRILMGISQRKYIRMQRRVLQVRRHFEVNSTPRRYDVFHMILHSVWLRRLNVHVRD